jgi:CHAT domain-containing protein
MDKAKKALKILVLSSFLGLVFFTGISFRQSKPTPDPSGSEIRDTYSHDSLDLIRLWNNYWAFDDTERFDSAIHYCNQIVALGEELLAQRYDSSLYEKYAKAHGGIGWNLMMKGQFDEALSYTRHSYDLITAKFGENHIRNTEICVGIAYNYLFRGDYDNAVKYIQKSLKIMHEIFPENHYYIGNNFLNLGRIYLEEGNMYKSIYYYKKSIENHRRTAPAALAGDYIELGNAYFQNEDFPEAIECARLSILESKKNMKNPWHYWKAGSAELLLAKSFFQLGDLRLSMKYATQTIVLTRENDGRLGDKLGDAVFLQGQIKELNGKWKEALESYQTAVNLWRDFYGAGTNKIPRAFNQIASLYAAQLRFDSAFLYHQKAIITLSSRFASKNHFDNPQGSQLNPSIELLKALEQKAVSFKKLYEHSDDKKMLEASLDTYRVAIALIKKMKESYIWDGSKRTLLHKSFPVFESSTNIALELFSITKEEQFLQTAFEIIEQSKASLLLEGIVENRWRNNQNVPHDWLVRFDNLKQHQSLYQKLIFEEEKKEKADSSKLFYWHDKTIAIKETLDSLQAIISKRYPYQDDQSPVLIPSFETIKKWLPDNNSMVLEYFFGDTTITVFAFTKERVFHDQFKIDARFVKKLVKLQTLLNQPDSSIHWKTDGRENQEAVQIIRDLYLTLVAPVLKQQHFVKKLIIIPDGLIGYIPFEILLYEDALPSQNFRELPYLGKKYMIRYEYAMVFLLNDIGFPKSGKGYFGFAPEYLSGELIKPIEGDSLRTDELYPGIMREGLIPLDFNKEEVREAGEIMKGKLFLGRHATKKAFETNAPEAKVLHLAMHALTNDEEPLYSQFIFSKSSDPNEDEALNAYELQNLRLKANIAILSACNTGRGKLQRGEGIMSLARAFKYAGCPNIVMSLWPANDASSKIIISSFVRNMKNGASKDEALQQAKFQFLASTKNEHLTHPFFWAGYVLVGDDTPIYPGKSKGLLTFLSTLGMLGLGGLFLLILKKLKMPA